MITMVDPNDPMSYENLQNKFAELTRQGRCHISPDGNHLLVKIENQWDGLVFLRYENEEYAKSLTFITWAAHHGLRLKPATVDHSPDTVMVHEKGTATLITGLDDNSVLEYKIRWF